MKTRTITPAQEVRRLRAELRRLHRLIAQIVDTIDHEAEDAYRRATATDAYRRGRQDGIREGRGLAEAEQARAWRAVTTPVARGGAPHAELEQRRWWLRDEQRTRETFGEPHPGDYPGRDGAA